MILFPVRHHSPAGARRLACLIRDSRPRLILIEGPSDATTLIPYLLAPDTRLPAAVLAYFPAEMLAENEEPRSSVWPFCAYSPEYTALKVGHEVAAELRFFDLPAGVIGLYPGPEPCRIKLIETSVDAPLADGDWQQALVHAQRSVAALFQRFQAATANPLALPEAYALFAPARALVDGPAVYLLDDEGQAIPLIQGWRIAAHLTRQPIAALFGRLRLAEGALHLGPLGLVTASPGTHLIRLC